MKFKRAGILTKIILIVILIYAVASLITLRGKIETAKEGREALQSQVETKAGENEDMEYAIEHSDDDEILREVARDKLGLAEYDEHVFYAN